MHGKTIKIFVNNIERVFHSDNSLHNSFRDHTYIEAAGGLVMNEKGRVLMIHRLGMWDLPKGKIEAGETPKKAAIREVKEECGIGKLKITKELPSTYHTYEMKGKKYLKRTFWYEMMCHDDSPLIPQVEEHIDEAKWMTKSALKKMNETNTYRSILEVLNNKE